MKSVLKFMTYLWVAFQCLYGEQVELSGIIIPRDHDGMYVRDKNQQIEIDWNEATQVALVVNTRLFKGLSEGELKYSIHSSKEQMIYNLPKGPIKAIKKVRNHPKQLKDALETMEEEKWLSEHGLRLYFNQESDHQQMASMEDPRFIGEWKPFQKPRAIQILGETYELSLKKGGQTSALLFNLLSRKDCKPFIHRATVVGERQNNGIVLAKEIHLLPIGDQASLDDPKLPRYLFIGDSISGNYDKGLRETLKGQFNIHHPPTNCGPSSNGVKHISDWLGAYTETGRHWDVISFNFGHWDAKSTKDDYQSHLEKVIAELKKTKAKLVWVTTCPVPRGFPVAGKLSSEGRAPGRTTQVMEKYLNPWALEVMKKHPEITICDQWQYVKDHGKTLYKEWWQSKDVHFSGKQAEALGLLLGEHVMKLFEKVDTHSKGKTGSALPLKDRGSEVVPIYKQNYAYISKKAYGLYDEQDAGEALPNEWQGVERLVDGFHVGHTLKFTAQSKIADGEGG